MRCEGFNATGPRSNGRSREEEPSMFLIFSGISWPPPPHFVEAVLGGLARVGVIRPADLSVQLRDGKRLGLLVGLAGEDASLWQMRRLPLLNVTAMQQPVSEVMWNPRLFLRREPWVDEVHTAVINEQLSLLRENLETSGASEDFVQRQLSYVHGELRVSLASCHWRADE